MAESFAELSREMGEARESLRSFTLGRAGFSQRAGASAISRVTDLCERMQRRFGAGKHAAAVAGTVTIVRNQVQAAKARLVILKRRAAEARTARKP
jgi:hypothetical protein